MVTVSTVIPTRNRPELLFERAIPSVLAQSFADWECVIVGDDTDEITVRLMAGLCADDPRFRFWNLPPGGDHSWHMGGVAAWNAGLGAARGEWRSYLADDDAYAPQHHAVLLSIAEGADFVFGRSGVYRDGSPINRWFGTRADPHDIVQGSYLAHRSLDLTGREAAEEGWDATMLRRILPTARVRQTNSIVHQYHPAPENLAGHRL
jgi:glycosyltransferase involved in cell wall biosynthesis